MDFAIEVEIKEKKDQVVNYNEIRDIIVAKLEAPERSAPLTPVSHSSTMWM